MLENRVAAVLIKPPPTTCQTPRLSDRAVLALQTTTDDGKRLNSRNVLVTTLPLSAARAIPYTVFSFDLL